MAVRNRASIYSVIVNLAIEHFVEWRIAIVWRKPHGGGDTVLYLQALEAIVVRPAVEINPARAGLRILLVDLVENQILKNQILRRTPGQANRILFVWRLDRDGLSRIPGDRDGI